MEQFVGLWMLMMVLCCLIVVKSERVCIIGSGIGGSSTAKFLRELDADLQLDVFEMRSEIGGRTKTMRFEGVSESVSLGASIMHKDNRYVMQFAKELNLEISTRPGGKWGIYDGHEFIFESSESDAIDSGKLFWRYGLNLMQVKKIVEKFIGSFDKIYDLQSKGVAFASPIDMLQALGMYEMTQISLAEMMVERGIAPKMINELLAAVNRVNYGQNCTLNAFAGLVGMGGTGGDLRVITEGFDQISKGLFKMVQARINMDSPIEEIVKTDEGKFILKRSGVEEKCDAVVIAAPLEQSSLKLPSTAAAVHRREFQLTQATFLRGTLKPSYFWNKPSLPNVIYTTENPKLPFSSIGCYTPENETNAFYKIFSRGPLTEDFQKKAFEDVEIIKTIPWRAYPHFTPPEKFSPFILEKGLVYINTIESAASAMEMSAVGGKNAALLIHHFLKPDAPATVSDEKQMNVEL